MDEPTAQYTVLARRFRPQTFDEVVGQQHVARALRNAIQQGRVAHAYLFTGARGVGKTSMARILSKALNCPNLVDGNPCNQCEICRNISAGQDVDVSEIDGASNRGIDDIRQLRANVNVKSMRTRFKMYIIDEVHMLTKEAFNALLKTLEEPPPGVKFVFCTTEPNKVPDTILSRCQRFDFQTIETQNIIVRLQEIAAAEGFNVEPAAVELVARRAAGSMRDSQSLFDQLLAFGGEVITPADVHRLLGTASDDRLIDLIQALIERRREAALEQLDDALRSGVQLGELVDQLLNYLRDLMVLAARTQSVPLLAVSAENRERLAGQAQAWGLRTVLAALEIVTETKGRMFRATYGRALVEMALVRLTLLQDLDALDQVIQALKSGAPLPAATPRPAPAVAAPAPSSPSTPKAPPRQTNPPVSGSVGGRDSSAAGGRSPVEPPPSAQTSSGRPVPPLDVGEQKKNEDELIDEVNSVLAGHYDDGPSLDVADHAPPSPAGLRPGSEGNVWAQVKSQIQDLLKTHVQAVSSVAISGPNELDLIFPKSYHFSKQYCEQPAQLGRLERLLEDVVGTKVRIRLRVVDDAAPPPEPKAATGVVNRRRIPDVIEDPFVQQVMTTFNATVVRIENVGGPTPEGSADVS
ncbi:MAG: DNA polymerase III subunit gamma/tau [Planctomycetaceae bacterium]|nr:DNA polymerase III subunit gamma/tau [Planctomycetaceae bacterium]